MISNTVSRSWTIIPHVPVLGSMVVGVCREQLHSATSFSTVDVDEGKKTMILVHLRTWHQSHDPGPLVYVTSKPRSRSICVRDIISVIWRGNIFLGTKFWSDLWTLCSCPARYWFYVRTVVLFHYISQGQTDKVLDTIFSETCLKILPKLFTASVFKYRLLR